MTAEIVLADLYEDKVWVIYGHFTSHSYGWWRGTLWAPESLWAWLRGLQPPLLPNRPP